MLFFHCICRGYCSYLYSIIFVEYVTKLDNKRIFRINYLYICMQNSFHHAVCQKIYQIQQAVIDIYTPTTYNISPSTTSIRNNTNTYHTYIHHTNISY